MARHDLLSSNTLIILLSCSTALVCDQRTSIEVMWRAIATNGQKSWDESRETTADQTRETTGGQLEYKWRSRTGSDGHSLCIKRIQSSLSKDGLTTAQWKCVRREYQCWPELLSDGMVWCDVRCVWCVWCVWCMCVCASSHSVIHHFHAQRNITWQLHLLKEYF